jgi:acylaminoacyl-peptidase
MNIWLAPVAEPAAARPLTRHTDRPIPFQWFARTGDAVLYGKDTGGDENFHLWCVGVDGSEPRDLTAYGAVTFRWYGAHRDDRHLVAVGLNDRDARWHDLYALDLRSGTRRLIHENTSEISHFFVDHDLKLRMATRTRKDGGGRQLLRWSEGRFEEMLAIDLEDDLNTYPLFFNRAGDAWYFLTSQGRNTAALFRVDWASGARRLVAEHARADVFGSIIVDPDSWEALAARCGYVTPQWIAIDTRTGDDLAFIAGEVGSPVEFVGQSEDGRYWIVNGSSPTRPATYFLVARDERRITKLFTARPELEGARLAPMHGVVIRARDGLEMVSYLTLPSDETGERPRRPLPMVLNVHGGPQARDVYGYRADHQWLANRGYAVLSVNYRGSNGFGKAHVNAGIKEWGGKMHDDLIDAVDWAVAEGIADRARIAIYGGSYGGYAAFVGATFTPEVFACSVPIVGITNLETMLAAIPPYWQAYFEHFAQRVGDPRTEQGRALLRARSPLYKAGNIARPMLIGHGFNDPRCRIAESDQIVAAMRERHIPVTYVVFPDEGHGFARPENRLAFNAITETFLARHLGGRCQPVDDDFAGSSHQVRAGAEILEDIGALPRARGA